MTSIDTASTPPIARGHRRCRLEVGIGDDLLRNRRCIGRRREQRGPAVRCAPRVVGDRVDEFDALPAAEGLLGTPQAPEPHVQGLLVPGELPGQPRRPCARRRNGDLTVGGGVGQDDRLAVLGRRIGIQPQPATLIPADLLLDHGCVAVREQPGREGHAAVGPPRPVHALDLVSLVRGTRGGGVQERNVDVGVDLHVPLGACAGDACGEELLQAFRGLCLDNRRVGLRERRRQLPPVHHPDPVTALAVELGEVEAHRLVAEVVDRRRARLAGLFRVRPGWVERVRAARRTPQVTLVGQSAIDPTVGTADGRVESPPSHALNRYASQPSTSRRNRSTSSSSSTCAERVVLRQLRADLPRVGGVAGVGELLGGAHLVERRLRPHPTRRRR